MNQKDNLGYYRRETIKLTIPVFLELLISSLFGMVGNSGPSHITTPSIAAIGITNQMMFIGIAMAQAISAGGTAMISRYCGAYKEEKVPNVVKHLNDNKYMHQFYSDFNILFYNCLNFN